MSGIAGIPLAVNPAAAPAGPNLGNVFSLADMAQQIQQRKQAMQSQNALRQILGQPGAVDPSTGMPSPQAMQAVYAVDPNAGMALSRNALVSQQHQAVMQEHQLKRQGMLEELFEPVRVDSYTAYQEARGTGMSDEKAREAAQKVYTDGVNGIVQGGHLSPDEQKLVNPQFDPQRVFMRSPTLQERYNKDQQITLDRARLAATGQTPAKAAEDDAKVIANAEISDRNKELAAAGQPPLNAAEEAKIRQKARIAPAAEKAGAVAAASTEARMKAQEVPQQAVNLAVDRFLSGDKTAISGFGRSLGIQRQIMGAIGDRAAAAGMSGADISAKIAEYAGAISGSQTIGRRMAAVYYAERAVQRMAPLALQSSEQIDRTKYPNINSIEQAVAKGTGDPDIVTFNARNQALVTEYGKFLDPQGAGTDTTRKTAHDMLETAFSKGQYKAEVEAMLTEIESGHTAAQLAIQDVTAGIAGKTVAEPPPQQPVKIGPAGSAAPAFKPYTGDTPPPNYPNARKAPPKTKGGDEYPGAWFYKDGDTWRLVPGSG